MKNDFHYKKRDEYYTPKILVEPLLDYIPKDKVIWCPFDTENSEYVLVFKENGYKVIHSHIEEDKDFFTYTPDESFDIIISNPPFTKKLDVLKRLYEMNKPFCLLLGLPILNYQVIGNFFLDKELQLLIVDKKVSFDGNTCAFNNSYFCYKFLPRDLMFVHLEHNNTGDNYVASRMYDK